MLDQRQATSLHPWKTWAEARREVARREHAPAEVVPVVEVEPVVEVAEVLAPGAAAAAHAGEVEPVVAAVGVCRGISWVQGRRTDHRPLMSRPAGAVEQAEPLVALVEADDFEVLAADFEVEVAYLLEQVARLWEERPQPVRCTCTGRTHHHHHHHLAEHELAMLQVEEEERHEEHPWTAGWEAAGVEAAVQHEELSGAEAEDRAV